MKTTRNLTGRTEEGRATPIGLPCQYAESPGEFATRPIGGFVGLDWGGGITSGGLTP